MDPFDEGYFARREKQIQDLYNMRAATWACLGLGVFLTVGAFLLRGESATLGTVLFLISLLFWISAFFMVMFSIAQRAADKAIQKEQERLLALYSQSGVKLKRGGEAAPVRLSDDGEIVTDSTFQEAERMDKGRGA